MNLELFPEDFLSHRHLLAFSGGPDSVYLLEKLREFYRENLSRHVELAYVNYHDSPYVEEEEGIVSHYQGKYGLLLHRKDVQTKDCPENFEDWARQVRYEFFGEIRSTCGLDDVLTAHHQDDSLETYLIQKERGNLPLCYGLAKRTDFFGYPLLRPLLSVTKEEIYRFLRGKGLPFYEDCTNHDDHTRRNLVRRSFPNVQREALLCEMEERNDELSRLYRSFENRKGFVDFSFYDRLREDERKRFVFYLIEGNRIGISQEKKESIANEIFFFLQRKADGLLSLSQKTLYRTKQGFFFARPIDEENYGLWIEKPGIYQTDFFTLTVSDARNFNMPSFPFFMRNNRKGDRIGTDLVSKDVHTFLKKQKVPFYYRKLYPVFLFEGQIRFVPFYPDVLQGKVPLRFTWPETTPSE